MPAPGERSKTWRSRSRPKSVGEGDGGPWEQLGREPAPETGSVPEAGSACFVFRLGIVYDAKVISRA